MIEETEETFIPMTFDNQFFYTTWRPGTVGLITFTVSAIDKSGNQATRQSTIEVKDPTGVLLPTISNLGAFPNPVMMGNSVQINITIVPPAQGGGTTPVVQFEITSPTGANYSPTGITQTGNVHSATFFPVDEGVHSVVAHVQWGETSYSKSCTFQVLSPDPESDFTVYPTETYLGNMVTLTLNPYSSNPNANITVQSMTFAGRPLTPVIQQNPGTGIPMYVATTTTITNSTGTNVAFAKFTDNFGNAEERQAQVNLKTPVVTITGFNITPSVGSQPQAYNPIHFEVILDKSTLPSGIVPSGEITISELGDTPRAQVTIPLVQDASETNVLQSQTDWLPPKEGTYSLAAKAVLQVGAFSFSAQQEEIVEVFPAAIDITLDSSPVSLERITVGRQIDLEFSVFGIPASDTVHSFQYAIYHEDNIHVAPRTLEEDTPGQYTDRLDPFMEAGPYQIIATVTTIAPAVKTKTWDFSVLPSEIRKKVFKLDGNSQNLVFGQPMDFILELENPTKIENLGIKMFLVDENYNRIMNIDPIVARVQDDEVFSQFKNETPFLLYQEASFTIAASITIEEVPQINLPTAYGDTIYHMYAPKTQIAIDGSRKYYRGYAGSIDVTVTKPVSMEIQPPVMTLANPADGTLEPTPYSSSSTYPTVINYRYKITPQVAGNIGVQAQLFEKEDTNFQNPVAEASQTLAVEEFQPRVIITGTEGENEFIQAKAPTVLLEISDVPEFFEGQFQFKARLDGNPSTEFPVVSPNSSATAQFFSNHLFDKLGADVVEISAVANSIGNETFSADGTRTFGVRLPSISNSRFPDYVINKTYHAFSESTMTVLFNNNDRVTENIRVDLHVYNPLTNSTDTYNSALTLSENSVDASALFSGIVFPNDGDYRIMAKALGTNSNPVELLDQTDWATVSSSDIGSFVDIKYPFSGQEIFVGEPLRPKAVLTNIPNVLSVRFDIVDSTGATVVSNGRTAKNTDGDWELLQEDVAILSNTGPATVKVTVSSEDLADMTKENTFQVIAGHFDSVTIKRQSGGFLIFPGEDLTFQSDFTFDNLNAVTPSVQAVARLQPLETTNYTIQRISESEQLNGELRQFTHQWLGNDASAPMIPGQYILDFSGSFMGETMAASLSFTVVSKVDWPEITLSPEAVNPGDSVTAQVLFLVPPSVVTWMEDQNATFSDYFSCNLTLGGILYEAFSRIETVNPDGRIDYLVGITGIAPDVGEDPGDSKTFTATAQPIIDSDVGETTTKQFTVTQD
ncbi:MAG TPA: hypothetical protein PLF96_13085 [Thermotogota bacterium]|nr:hypothetical protein [Thermotogota bacterium]